MSGETAKWLRAAWIVLAIVGVLGLALALLAIDTAVTILEVGATWLWGVRLLILYVVLSAFLQLRAERRVTSAAGEKIAE